jgi:tRNA(adenine34) deaminase
MKIEYMQEALREAQMALQHNDFPVGCVIANNDGIIARGRRLNSSVKNELDHAEIMALRELNLNHPEKSGEKLIAYSTMEPCLMCFSAMLLNNVRTVVYSYEDVMGGGTNLVLEQLKPLYAAMTIEIIPGVLRSESLKLFQQFFSEDSSGYWQDSLLAQYTLAQTVET